MDRRAFTSGQGLRAAHGENAMKRLFALLLVGLWLITLGGCAALQENGKTYEWGKSPEEGGLSGYPWSSSGH